MIGRLEQYSQIVLEESLLAQNRMNVIRILDVKNDQAYQLGNNCNRQECIKRNGKGLPKVYAAAKCKHSQHKKASHNSANHEELDKLLCHRLHSLYWLFCFLESLFFSYLHFI